MTIYLVRHGETLLNVARTLQPADTPLSPHGEAQAAAVAQWFRTQGIAGILSSDLPRASRTAELIGLATGVQVGHTPLLQERNFGDLRGLPYDGLGYDPLRMEDAPPGGESAAQFVDRVAQAMKLALTHRAGLDGPLVLVTHGLVIRKFLEQQVRIEPPLSMPGRLGNTSVTRFDWAPPHRVDLLDSTVHLGEQNAEDAQSLSGG